VGSFNDVVNKYNASNPQSDITLKSPVKGMDVKIPIVTEFVDPPPATVYVGDGINPSSLKPGDLYVDSSTGNLIIGDNGGPMFGPKDVPVILGGPDSLRTVMDGRTAKSDLYTTTSYTQSSRTHDLPKSLSTKDLMFIKDRIEEGYSYIKIKNLDELKHAFKRLGCYISDSDVSTLATVGVFQLENGKYAIIN
jgi:hypothetical protein